MAANANSKPPEQRRSIRRSALLLAAFALVVYVGFIVTFVYSHS